MPVTYDQKYKCVCPFLSTATIKCKLCSIVLQTDLMNLLPYFDLRVIQTIEIWQYNMPNCHFYNADDTYFISLESGTLYS